jgi:hypothetical protein
MAPSVFDYTIGNAPGGPPERATNLPRDRPNVEKPVQWSSRAFKFSEPKPFVLRLAPTGGGTRAHAG